MGNKATSHAACAGGDVCARLVSASTAVSVCSECNYNIRSSKTWIFFCSLFACISKSADSYYTVSAPGRQSPRTGWCGCRRASSPASPPTCIVASLVCGSTFLLGATPVGCIFLKLHANKKQKQKRAVAHFLCTPSLPPALCLVQDIIVHPPEERALSDNSSPVTTSNTEREARPPHTKIGLRIAQDKVRTAQTDQVN